MGYSPGDFKAKIDGELQQVHFEAKDGPRIVLWNDRESRIILDVDEINAERMFNDLRTCLLALGVEL